MAGVYRDDCLVGVAGEDGRHAAALRHHGHELCVVPQERGRRRAVRVDGQVAEDEGLLALLGRLPQLAPQPGQLLRAQGPAKLHKPPSNTL